MLLLSLFYAEKVVASPYSSHSTNRRIDSVEFSGVPEELVDELRSGLAVTVRTGFLRMSSVRFEEKEFEQDRERIRYFLARHGFPDAHVSATVEQVPKKAAVRIHFDVVTGPEVKIGRVELEGSPPMMSTLGELASSRIPTGIRFAESRISAFRDTLQLRLLNNGYAMAKVSIDVRRTDPESADVTYKIVAGDRYRIDSVSAEGISCDLVPLACKTMNVKPGILYDPRIVDRARTRLRELQLFRQIRLELHPKDTMSLNLRADLKTSPPRTARISIGSWSDDPWRVRALWRHRNLFRRGRGFELQGTYSLYSRMAGSGVWWPALLSSRSRTDLSYRYEVEDEESYYLASSEVELANLLRFGTGNSLRFAVSLANVEVDIHSDDPDVYTGIPGRQFVLLSRWLQDAVDDVVSPTRGRRLTLDAAWSPADFLSNSPYWAVKGQESHYLSLGKRFVLAGRLAFSLAGPLGDADDLLPNRRVFAGGVTTQRGFKRRQLGPVDDAGDPIGGEAGALAGLELRFPLRGFIGGALFLDGGRVWLRRDEMAIRDFEIAGGPGILFNTPIGPVRLDFAFKLTPPPRDLSRFLFHIAIGHPY